MLSYEADIQQALDNAPIIVSGRDSIPVSGNTDSEFRKYFADKTDYSTVRWNIGETPVSEGNQIIVPTIGELEKLQRQVASAVGGVDDITLADNVRHEGEHAIAAQTLGARRIVFGVNLWRVFETAACREEKIGWQLFVQPIDLRAPKLGVAAITAHPMNPSAGDISDIVAMGYDGLEEVGFRASEHNRKYTDKIPVPLSYKPSLRRYISLWFRKPFSES